MTTDECDDAIPTDAEFLDAVETSLLAGIRLDWRIVDRLMAYCRRGAAVQWRPISGAKFGEDYLPYPAIYGAASDAPTTHFIPLTALGRPGNE